MVKDTISEVYQKPMNGRENGNKVIQLRLSIFVYYLCIAKSIRGACNQHNVATNLQETTEAVNSERMSAPFFATNQNHV